MTWQFNADDYAKRVLSPAREVFKNEGRLPDVFERYALPIDVSDARDIETALDKVTAYWNRYRTNPKYQPLLSMLLAQKEQKEAKGTLLDPLARAALRSIVEKERQERQAALFAALDASVRILAGKGFVTPAECRALVARFERDGLAEVDILGRLHVPIREAAVCLPTDEGLPNAVRTQIRANLALLGKRDLYEFIGFGLCPGSSTSHWTRACKDSGENWRHDRPSIQKTAAQALLGHAQSFIGDPTRYDRAFMFDVAERVRSAVDAAASPRRVSVGQLTALLALVRSRGVLDETVARETVFLVLQEKGVVAEHNGNQPISRAVSVCARGIGIRRLGAQEDQILLHPNTLLPAEVSLRERTTPDSVCRVVIVEQDSALASSRPEANRVVSQANIEIPSDVPVGSPIDITLRLDEDGTLKVRAVEPSSGRELKLEAKVEGVMSQQEVEEKKGMLLKKTVS